MKRAALWTTALALLFAFRLGFGLASEFFFEDETQVFLLGLQYHSTGSWPYFGPDVVWTRSEIPGALQALLVGVPMDWFPWPEAPFVLLNILSMASLCLLAWYISARLPSAPPWLIWGWLLTVPWTLQFSTHIVNTSYILPASIVFFVGFFEAHRSFTRHLLSVGTSFFMMGAALCWLMQIHMSWPLVVPFALLALCTRRRTGGYQLGLALLAFAAGTAVTGSLLAPTFWNFPLHASAGGTQRNLHLHWVNPSMMVTTLARLFSFASLEVLRFLGIDSARRLLFLVENVWLVPFTMIVWAAGIIQPLWMAYLWFKRESPHPDWAHLRWLVLGTVTLIYVSYFFVMEPPQAHAFYVVSPVAFMYAFYCWTFVDSPRARTVAAALLAVSIVFHAGLALGKAPGRSLYKDRPVVAEAVATGRPGVLGHRRAFAYGGKASPGNPADLQIVGERYSIGIGGMVVWSVTVRNVATESAYRDFLYETAYRGDGGQIVDVRHGLLREVVQPGETRPIPAINDGFVKGRFTSATLQILAAERLDPRQRPGPRSPNPVARREP